MAVFLGKNGTGKSTLFDVFGFMKECLLANVSAALQARGGYQEVHSRGADGDIQFIFQYRMDDDTKLCTYELSIGYENRPIINREVLRYRRGSYGSPWKFVDFAKGEGVAITNEDADMKEIDKAERESFTLDAPDILAIKSLGQMKRFRAAVEFRRFIEDWFVSDFQIDSARQVHETAYNEQLTHTGDNLANVAQFKHDQHPEKFRNILTKMKTRVPGIDRVDAKTTEDGRIILRFSDGRFQDPFAARFVSDGTIKMFAYLLMLANPNPHMLLCIEEPENQLYPQLLPVLLEEFREYAASGGQVLISTHSPDLVNAAEIEEVYLLSKQSDGFTEVVSAGDNPQVVRLVQEGDQLGELWLQDLLWEEK